jgi:hypothetical protein
VETLPDDFSYVEGSVVPREISATVTDQKVSFALVGEQSFTYKAQAPGTAGTYTISGDLVYGVDKTIVPIGDTEVPAAQQSDITVTRSISPTQVPAGGGEITVTITINGSYGIGSVVETLPDDFSYVEGSVVPREISATVTDQSFPTWRGQWRRRT